MAFDPRLICYFAVQGDDVVEWVSGIKSDTPFTDININSFGKTFCPSDSTTHTFTLKEWQTNLLQPGNPTTVFVVGTIGELTGGTASIYWMALEGDSGSITRFYNGPYGAGVLGAVLYDNYHGQINLFGAAWKNRYGAAIASWSGGRYLAQTGKMRYYQASGNSIYYTYRSNFTQDARTLVPNLKFKIAATGTIGSNKDKINFIAVMKGQLSDEEVSRIVASNYSLILNPTTNVTDDILDTVSPKYIPDTSTERPLLLLDY